MTAWLFLLVAVLPRTVRLVFHGRLLTRALPPSSPRACPARTRRERPWARPPSALQADRPPPALAGAPTDRSAPAAAARLPVRSRPLGASTHRCPLRVWRRASSRYPSPPPAVASSTSLLPHAGSGPGWPGTAGRAPRRGIPTKKGAHSPPYATKRVRVRLPPATAIVLRCGGRL